MSPVTAAPVPYGYSPAPGDVKTVAWGGKTVRGAGSMSFFIDDLYKVTDGDIRKSCSVLAAAFGNDPLWNAVLRGEPDLPERIATLFEIPLRYVIRFGTVYAPSSRIEGVMGVVPAARADMTFFRMVASGGFPAMMRLGIRTSLRMRPIGTTLPPDRKAHMRGRAYLYLFFLGVDPAFQRKGVGGMMLRKLIEAASKENLTVYLETETEKNAAWYRKAGFDLLKEVQLAGLNVPMWEMARCAEQATG